MSNKTYSKHTGNFSVSAECPLVNGGAATAFSNFKLEENFVDTTPQMDNAKFIPLANGGSIMIVNSVKGGTLKFSAVSTSDDPTDDIVAYAAAMINANSAVGATITIAIPTKDSVKIRTFYSCFPNKPIPLKMAGNDEPSYDTEFVYADWA